MPRIAEIKEIDGDLWVKIGKPGQLEFKSGVALWTPEEQKRNYVSGYRNGYEDGREGAKPEY